MRKQWRWWLGLALLLSALAWKWAGAGPGPVYADKTARAWLRELARSEPERREAALRAFGAMGQEVVPLLKQELACRDSIIKRGLMRASARLPWIRIEWLTDAQRRRMAIFASETLGQKAEVLLPQLLQAFYEQNETGWVYPSTRVFEGLGAKAVPAMIEAMKHPRAQPLQNEHYLLQAWVRIHQNEGLSQDLSRELFDLALQRLEVPQHDKEAISAMELIAEFPAYGGRAMPSLLHHLREGSPQICHASIQVLETFGREPDQVVQALISRLKDPDENVRRIAVKSLPSWGAAAITAIPAIAERVRDDTRAVQLAALNALGQMGAEAGSTAPVLLEALERGETWVKAEAARTLGLVCPDAAAAVPALTRVLSEYDRDIRCHAATSLGVFGGAAASAVDALVATLSDHREAVQVCVVQALGKIGAPARPAIPHLMAAWNNNQSLLVGPVNDAIRRIEGGSEGGGSGAALP